jgi:hypothetical protein
MIIKQTNSANSMSFFLYNQKTQKQARIHVPTAPPINPPIEPKQEIRKTKGVAGWKKETRSLPSS